MIRYHPWNNLCFRLRNICFPWILSNHTVVSKPPIASKSPEVSTLPEPPVKKAPVKTVASVIHQKRSPRSRERQNEKRMPRDTMLYRRPDFRPLYRRPEPRVFRRPPWAQQLMPTSKENAEVFFHSQGFLCCVLGTIVCHGSGKSNVQTNRLNFYTISMSVSFVSPTNILNKNLKKSKRVGAPRVLSSGLL
ncbi:hypothetical protein TNCV_3359031 [Trichonephila clavipes]|nr:hypothetical protein TNCV_3359031 [Trichonephila clavipes]